MSANIKQLAGNLPDELLLNIFSQVPRESLANCLLVNDHWRYIICSYFYYRRIQLHRGSSVQNLLMVLDRTADNRSHPDRQSFYSRTNYSAMIRHLSFRCFRIDWKTSFKDIVRLISYCNNLESICLCDQYLLRDDDLVKILKQCPQLKHLCLDGLYHISASVFQHLETKAICDQLESLIIGSLRFNNPLQSICFPSLKYLRLHMHTPDALFGLLEHCRETLKTLLITVHGWKTKSSEWVQLEQAFLELPELKKLGLAVSRRNNANITSFGVQLNDIELVGPFLPETFWAISRLKKLRRVCFVNCPQPTDFMETMLYNNKDNLITFVGDNIWRKTDRSKPPLQLPSSLRCLGINPGGKQDWKYLDDHRNSLEELHISMVDRSKRNADACWSSIVKAPWPNVKFCFLCVDPLAMEDIARLPATFPNVEYIVVDNDNCREFAPQVYAILNQFPFLRGARLRLGNTIWNETTTPLERNFITWETETHTFIENRDTILSPLVTLNRLSEDWWRTITSGRE